MSEEFDAVVEAPSSGTSLLVTGASRDVVRPVPARLVAGGGTVLVATRDGPTTIGESLPGGRFGDGALAVVDCTPGEGVPFDGGLVRQADSPADLTGVSVAVERCLDELERRGVGRPHLVVDSLSSPLASTDSATVARFAHSLALRIVARGGIGVFPVYTNVTTGTALERLKHVADGMFEVRKREGTRQVRSRGIEGTPDRWLSVRPPDDARPAATAP